MRALATVEQVVDVRPIEGADRIEVARVRGWDVIVSKNRFTPGDLCVYFEIDSFLPEEDERFADLMARGVRVHADGSRGHVLKTIKLRGQVSQGLALPLTMFALEVDQESPNLVGLDVTDALGVKLWSPPMPAELAGKVEGRRPGWIVKTDEERIQNLGEGFIEIMNESPGDWVPVEKIDGTSMTVYVDDTSAPRDGVCSRNLELKRDESNAYWAKALELYLFRLLNMSIPAGTRAYVQGELYGEGIQGNPLGMSGTHFAIFNFNVNGEFLPRQQWPTWALLYAAPVSSRITSVPSSVDEAIAQVDGLESVISPGRKAEGVVWRNRFDTTVLDSEGMPLRASCKVISNSYLLKHDR